MTTNGYGKHTRSVPDPRQRRQPDSRKEGHDECIFNCNLCPLSFTDSDSLRSHYINEHIHEEMTDSDDCVGQLLLDSHKEGKRVTHDCNICAASFRNSNSLRRHIVTQHIQ